MGTKPKKLEPKEQRFIEEYLVDFNGAQAVLRAGYRCKNERVAAVYASRLLTKVHIQDAIAKRVKKQFGDKADDKLQQVIQEAERLSFSDFRQLFDKEGKLLPAHQLPDDIAACVSSVEVEEIWEGRGEARVFKGYQTKVKLWDKNSALDKLFRYHALYKDPGTKENPLHVKDLTNLLGVPVEQFLAIKEKVEAAIGSKNS